MIPSENVKGLLISSNERAIEAQKLSLEGHSIEHMGRGVTPKQENEKKIH